MTTASSELECSTTNVNKSCATIASYLEGSGVTCPSQSTSIMPAGLNLKSQQQKPQQQSVVNTSLSTINRNYFSTSFSSSSSLPSSVTSSSSLSAESSISPSQSNSNNTQEIPLLTDLPTSSANLIRLGCISNGSGMSSLLDVSFGKNDFNSGNCEGPEPDSSSQVAALTDTSTLIEYPRTLKLALELSMFGLPDPLQNAAVAAGVNNSQSPDHRQQQQQHNYQQEQQQLQKQNNPNLSQSLQNQFDINCGIRNPSGVMVQSTCFLPQATTLNHFAASILPGLEDRSKKSQNMTECVPVPSSEHVAEIVGRQGCKIKALRAKTNTYIKTPVRGEEPVFVVTGRKEDVAKAKREILSAAEHFSLIRANRKPHIAGTLGKVTQEPPSIPGQITIQVRVPYRVVGLVVGPKGATIKHIQQETHTYIVTPSREKEPIFEVTGLPDNVQAARKQIEGYIALRTSNLSSSVQTMNSLTPIQSEDEPTPELLSSIYKYDIYSTFDYNDPNVPPDETTTCGMVPYKQPVQSILGNVSNNSNQFQQRSPSQKRPLQQLHQKGVFQQENLNVTNGSNIVMNVNLSRRIIGNNGNSNRMANNSVGVNGMSTSCSRSCSSSSSSTPSKSTTISRPELMNTWENIGESQDADEGLGDSPNIWTLPTVANAIECSPTQSESPADSLLGAANSPTGSCFSQITSSGNTSNSNTHTNPTRLISLVAQQNNNSCRECLMCGDKEVAALLVPCGHNMFCMDCANYIGSTVNRSCPMCNQTVYNAVPILP